jgi:hypothetical protein
MRGNGNESHWRLGSAGYMISESSIYESEVVAERGRSDGKSTPPASFGCVKSVEQQQSHTKGEGH